jgi:cyclopropane-fatty-acyl-phospholipid synthase
MEAIRERPAGASAGAIQRHYDLSDDFYRLWLDPTMTYSCPMWRDPADDPAGAETLEEAQRRKYAHHVAQSGAAGRARVLDVGCGWGGQLRHLSEVAGVSEATGLTLSATQAAHVESLGLRGVSVRLESWADHAPAQPYDAAISIGAFEHFAQYGVSQDEKLAGYRRFFGKMHALLAPGGRLSLQTMAYGTIPRGARHRDLFIATEIFPESDFPRLADIAEAAEGSFEVLAVRNDRMDYARAYRAWFDALRAREREAVALVGDEAVERYKRYLRLFSYSFEMGAFDLLRLTLRRIDRRPDPA